MYVACSADTAKRVQSQLCAVIRPMYSSPPAHGAAIVVKVLSDPQLYSLWKQELAAMSHRIIDMRTALKSALLEVRAGMACVNLSCCLAGLVLNCAASVVLQVILLLVIAGRICVVWRSSMWGLGFVALHTQYKMMPLLIMVVCT